MAQSEASREIDKIFEKMNTAQHQWNTLADRIGAGYFQAYREHVAVLKSISEKRKADSEKIYFLLSALSMGLAGGLVGGLMAPWIKAPGISASQAVWREIFKEEAKKLLEKGYDGISKEITGYQSLAPPPDPFVPASTEPGEYNLDMKSEIGICFSRLRDRIEEAQKEADAKKLSQASGAWFYEKILQSPLIGGHPKTKDIPAKDVVAREALIGMWIAWANARDMDYWNKRYDLLKDGLADSGRERAYVDNYDELAPILKNLQKLGVAGPVTMNVRSKWTARSRGDIYIVENMNYVLNIHALQQLGKYLNISPFISRIAEVAKSPTSELEKMKQLKAPFN